MKRLITISLFLFPLFVLSQTTTTFNFTAIPITTDFLNWDRGATLWNEQDAPNGTMNIPVDGSPQKMKDAYHRFGMTEFFGNASASDSTIIFTRLDNFFNYCIDNKMGARFRVMGLCNNCGNPAIGDNFNNQIKYPGDCSNCYQVIPQFLHNLQQADPDVNKRDFLSTRGDQTAWVPNVNSWPYQRWVGKLSTAIKNHINATSHNGISYADVLRIYDLGYYGCYSEQHSNCICDQINDGNIPVGARHTPDDSGIQAIVNQQTNAFGGNTKWKIVIPFNSYDAMWLPHTYNPVSYGNFLLNHPDSIGWIDDHLGSDDGYDHDYLEFNDRINNSKLMSRWKYSPHGGEPVEWGAPADRSAIPNYVTKYHLTFFGNGNLNGVLTNSNTTEANNFRLGSRLAGYRLRLTGGSAVTTSTLLTINLNWLNEGNCPPYWSWNVQYLIKNGSTVSATLNSSFNPRYFQPSTEATTISQTFGMPAIPSDTYGLYVIVKDPSGYRDAMFLANTPRQADGSYFLGNISVTTGTANQSPVANAGINQSITTTSTTLNGTGSSDPDGTISTYAWTQVGTTPNTATIVSPSSATTSITGLVSGTYTFNLTVTDNSGATSSDQVQITVATANQAPIANAGVNQTITTAGGSLSGSGTDDVGITSYLWSQQTGPNVAVIGTPTAASTTIGGLVLGVYVFRLTVSDAGGLTGFDDVQVTVTSGNTPPIANAGSNITVTLPVVNFSTILLDGSLSSDPGGAVASYLWTQVGGTTVTITAPTNVATYINNVTVAGFYIFRLTVTDNLGLTSFDDVQVTVNAVAPVAPVANAGANQTITLPTNSVTVNSSASTDDIAIVSRIWSKVSGPTSFSIVSPTAVSTSITTLVAGVYVFRITVTDGGGLTDFDEVTITVLAVTNAAPVAVAGINQSITLPTNSTSVNGSGSTDDVAITVYLWTKVSGPAGGTITTPNSVSTTITGLQQGTYVYRLRVQDAQGLFDTDELTIIVNPVAGNLAPVAIITTGTPTIQLPISSVNLSGTSSTDDVAVTAYLWTQISGPSTATIATPTSSTTNMNNLVAGIYTFQLQVSDVAGLTDTDQISITVLAADPPDPPILGNKSLFKTGGIKFLPRIP